MNSKSLIKGGSFKGTTAGEITYDYHRYWGHSENLLKRQNFWMYALDPNSKKYVEGKILEHLFKSLILLLIKFMRVL